MNSDLPTTRRVETMTNETEGTPSLSTKELAGILRRGFGSALGRKEQLMAYDAHCVLAAEEIERLERDLSAATQELVDRRKTMADIVRLVGHGCCGLSNDELVEKVRKILGDLSAATAKAELYSVALEWVLQHAKQTSVKVVAREAITNPAE